MRRLLIVAYYFPPIGGIGSIRMTRFAELLPEFGWEVTVIAPRRTPHKSDPNLRYSEERVIRSPSIEVSRLGRVARMGPAGASAGISFGMRRHLRAAAYRFIFYPDAQIGWYPGAVTVGLRACRRRPFDLVYSSSNPITAHLVARTLSRSARLPWVAEFRDPWSERLPPDHPYRQQAQALMRSLGLTATHVIVPTPTLAEHYGRLWGREVAVVLNGHDVERPVREPPERLTLTHLGTYYPQEQSFRALWEALAAMMRSEFVEPPRIRFIGELPVEIRRETAALGLQHLVEATGFLPHDEAVRAMMSSSLLIASGLVGKDPVSRGVVPAKLFEYLASGLPILYLGHHEDDAARILQGQPGCYVVEPADVRGVRAVLRDALRGLQYERDVTKMTRRARTAELAAVLDRAAAAPRSGFV